MLDLRRLGNSDIFISPIGLGCWQFSGGKGMAGRYWPALPQEEVNEIIRLSLEGGINWFDTAEAYGKGVSEQALANGLKANEQKNGDVIVATKWFPMFRFASSISSTIKDRIKFLDGFSIDLHQIHNNKGAFSSHKKQLDAMAGLYHEGKIKTVGVSNFKADEMRFAYEYLSEQGVPMVSNQIRYSLLHRMPETNRTVQVAKELGITIIAYSPLAQGLLTGKFHENPSLIKERQGPRKYLHEFSAKGMEKSKATIDKLAEIAEKHHKTSAQVALRWLIQYHGDTVVVIPGATKAKHAEQNVGALHFELDEEDLLALDRVSHRYLR